MSQRIGSALLADRKLADEAQSQLAEGIRTFSKARTAVDSPLFDVAAKMVFGQYASAHAVPQLVRTVSERATPEEIGGRLKTVGFPLAAAPQGLGYTYAIGRMQLYMDAGWPDKEVSLGDEDEAAEVLTWWARLLRTYRNDGKLIPGVGGARYELATLPPDSAAELAERALARGPFHDVAAIRHALAQIGMYVFVMHAEARDGIHQHGPYPLDDGRVLIVREFTDLQSRWMPGISEDLWLPVPKIVIPMILDKCVDVRFDIFTMFSDPEDYLPHVLGAEILAGDDLTPITEAELTAIADASRPLQRKRFADLARWDDRTKVTHCAGQYGNMLQGIALAAGFTPDDVDRVLVRPYEAAGEPYLDRATGPNKSKFFARIGSDALPLFPRLN